MAGFAYARSEKPGSSETNATSRGGMKREPGL